MFIYKAKPQFHRFYYHSQQHVRNSIQTDRQACQNESPVLTDYKEVDPKWQSPYNKQERTIENHVYDRTLFENVKSLKTFIYNICHYFI